jgi:hypothetical protein
MSVDRNWFIHERSEALATLLLTSRSDLIVEGNRKQDDGVDFYVAIKEAENPVSTRLFVVQVKGTLSTDPDDWTENVKQLFKSGGSPLYLPVCVFVVNVRQNDMAYAWIAEPEVKSNAGSLNFFEHPDFHELNSQALDQIVNQVKAWYGSMPNNVVPRAS